MSNSLIANIQSQISNLTNGEMLPLSCRFTPSHSLVNPAIFEKTEEGQKARLDELKGRWVAIITSGFELTKVSQYERMHALGLKIFLVEEEGNAVAEYLSNRKIATHVPVDLSPTNDLVDRVIAALSKVAADVWNQGERPNINGMDEPGMLSGCWTIWDDGVCLASRVQSALGLRGDVPGVIDTCHDKYLARKRLEENGVPGPTSVLIRNAEDVKELGVNLRYPIVVKPINGAASIGIHFFSSHSEFLEKYDNCLQELVQVYEDDELLGLVFEDSNGVSSRDALHYFCAEEFIGGREYDVDILFADGEAIYANVGQDWKYKAGWMCERGMHHPATMGQEEYNLICEFAVKNAKALGCTTGVYHVEMKNDPILGPQMIECNPRMGGGPVYDFHKNVWDVDLIVEAAFAFIGLPNAPVCPEKPLGCSISLLLFSDISGILRDDIQSVNRHISDNQYTTFFMCPGKKGDEIRGWSGDRYPSHLGRVDYFIKCDDPLFETALEWGLQQRANFIIPLENGDHHEMNDDSLGD